MKTKKDTAGVVIPVKKEEMYGSINKQLESFLSEAKQNFEKAIVSIEEQFEIILKTKQIEHSQVLDEMKRKNASELINLQNENKIQVDDIQYNHSQELRKFQTDFEASKKNLKDQFDQLVKEKGSYEQLLKENESLKKEVQNLKDQFIKDQLKEQAEEFERTSLIKDKDRQIESLTEELGKTKGMLAASEKRRNEELEKFLKAEEVSKKSIVDISRSIPVEAVVKQFEDKLTLAVSKK